MKSVTESRSGTVNSRADKDACSPTRLGRMLSGMSDPVTRLNTALEGRYAIMTRLTP